MDSKTSAKAIVQPYLFFGGRCDEALEFYKKALGAQVGMLMRFKDSPEALPPNMPPGSENRVMHTSFRVGDTVIMASDGCDQNASFNGFSLSLTFDNESDADRVFGLLSEGGKVQMPMSKTFWSPRFGMLTDRFGVAWMVGVAHDQGEHGKN